VSGARCGIAMNFDRIAPFYRIHSRFILKLLYGFFRMTCNLETMRLSPPDRHLLSAGFTLHRRVSNDWDLLKSE
jgi:hypothetical protein